MEGTPLVNLTVIVPAGLTGVSVDVQGKHVKIVSCTVASVLMGFDAGNVERVYPDDCYAGPLAGFKHLRFVQDVGACTVVIQVSEQPILGGISTALLPIQALLTTIDADTGAMATDIADSEALLTTIDADTGAIATDAAAMEALLTTIDADTGAIAIDAAAIEVLLTSVLEELTGETTAATFANETTLAAATATSILAASATRHGSFIQAKSTNAASIYIGSDNTVTNTKWMMELEPGEGYTFDDYPGAIYAYSVAGADKIAYGSW